jgi:hypothetical protein
MKANENMHKNFYCYICDYECSKKTLLDQHNLTSKHMKAKNGLMKANKKYACENCNIEFRHQSSFCRHKKKCINSHAKNNDIVYENIHDKDLIMMLVKQNTELIEVLKNGTHNNSHNTNTNSLNKTFNLQFFLNETCKDAMNIMDFVDSIKLQLSDLEKVGEIGYVEGISNIITSNLKALDVNQRPIHCTDKKREILYIKDEDKWEKEDEDKMKLRKAIKRVASKNQRLLPEFKQIHPDCIKSASPFSDQYNKMIVESMGGSGDNDIEKEDKIIKKISSVTTIDK